MKLALVVLPVEARANRSAVFMLRTVALVPFLVGCVQLVAFDQAIIGQPDVVPGDEGHDATLCDPEVEMGTNALCTESCEIDAATAETSCSERVQLDGSRGTIDVAGLHEVELTLTICRREGEHFFVEGHNGASFAMRDRSLHVLAAEAARARPFEDASFLPDADGCEERTVIVQTGRMGLEDTGQRLCSAHLVPVDGQWSFRLSRTSIRSVELCFRAPRDG